MARVTVEDCLEREENRFALVVLAAARTRALMKPNAQPLVKAKNKAAVLSLREIARGYVRFHRPSSEVVQEWLASMPGSHLATNKP
jgi:DNA-directed RNA polymerase subunit omega